MVNVVLERVLKHFFFTKIGKNLLVVLSEAHVSFPILLIVAIILEEATLVGVVWVWISGVAQEKKGLLHFGLDVGELLLSVGMQIPQLFCVVLVLLQLVDLGLVA